MEHDNVIQAISVSLMKHVPGISTAIDIAEHLQQKKQEEARDILFQEISGGVLPEQILATNPEDFANNCHRYFSACRKGAQVRNLKMLARAMRLGLAEGDTNSDAFDQFATRVEVLTREEILLISSLYRNHGSGGNTWKTAAKELIPSPFPDEATMEAVGAMATRTSMVTDIKALEVNYFRLSPIGIEICRKLGDTFHVST